MAEFQSPTGESPARRIAESPLVANPHAGADRAPRRPEVRELLGLNLFHGSSSASLADVFVHGLQPIAELTRSGRAPYSGELAAMNYLPARQIRECCNFGAFDSLTEVVTQYCLVRRNYRGWNPERSESHIAQLQRLRALKAESPRAILASPELFDTLLRIELQRQERWKTLAPETRELISHPFPVLYATSIDLQRPSPEWRSISNQIGISEIGVKRSIQPNDLYVFVPQAELSRVRQLASRLNTACRVGTLDDLARHLDARRHSLRAPALAAVGFSARNRDGYIAVPVAETLDERKDKLRLMALSLRVANAQTSEQLEPYLAISAIGHADLARGVQRRLICMAAGADKRNAKGAQALIHRVLDSEDQSLAAHMLSSMLDCPNSAMLSAMRHALLSVHSRLPKGLLFSRYAQLAENLDKPWQRKFATWAAAITRWIGGWADI